MFTNIFTNYHFLSKQQSFFLYLSFIYSPKKAICAMKNIIIKNQFEKKRYIKTVQLQKQKETLCSTSKGFEDSVSEPMGNEGQFKFLNVKEAFGNFLQLTFAKGRVSIFRLLKMSQYVPCPNCWPSCQISTQNTKTIFFFF